VTDRALDWRAIEKTLRGCGFGISKASTGSEALMRLRKHDYEAVFLDLDLPRPGGVEACTEIRAEFPTIWIVVAAQNRIEDWVQALNAGADHCITKPFHIREFAARIHAIARRLRITAANSRAPLIVGNFHLDLAKHVVNRDGQEIRLTTTEFNLLYQLMASAGQPIPYSALLDIIWGNHTEKEREYLRIYISQLRKKLEVEPTQPRFLLTYRSVGYIFANPCAASESIH
jgi:two-component system KDP operon response regulator KdpE